MARLLKDLSLQRRTAALLLIATVLGLHVFVAQRVAQRMADFAALQAMPQRITVAYVRELELAAPPPAPPVVVAPAPPRVRAAAPAAPALPASAPVVAEPEPAAAAAAERAAVPASDGAASAPVVEQASADPEAAPAETATAAFEWPTSTRISYTLTGNYRGEVNGDAQVEWVRVGTRYQVHIDLGVGPRFAPLITRRMSSEGELVGDRLLPSRYDEETRVLFREPRRVTILLGPEQIILATGEKRERAAGVQDTASQFIQLAALFATRPELLQTGNTIEILLALRNRIGVWIYDVLGEEDIQTPFGPLATWHLQPRRAGATANDLTAEVWFAPQLRNLPVRLRIRQDAETFIDLVISRRPEIAAQ